jgi:hypothetical protein
MVRKLEPWSLLLIARRIYQIGRPLGSKIRIARRDLARKQRRQRLTVEEGKRRDGKVNLRPEKRNANILSRDQELRYTVHDSPDYYQLKVSVFNDDKKTDLIGETWVDLKEVVVPGGGQNDLWHTLSCKGKYAGEIRIEITYYDTRPKQEKPEKIKQAGANGVEDGKRDSLRGPRQPKAPVKRRPLPSDPVTGAPAPLLDYNQTPPRGYPPSPAAVQEYSQTPPRGYQPSPSAIPEHLQTPSRGHQSPNFIPNQSPLQSVEYSTPPQFSQSQGYDSPPTMNGYGAMANSQPMSERYEMYDPTDRNDFTQGNSMSHYDEHESIDPHDRYSSHVPYELPQPEDFGPPPSPGGPPPPPPAHRSRNNSAHVSPAPAMTSHGSYGFAQDRRPSNPYETPPHDAHRHSMPAYSNSNSYQPYTPEGDRDQFRRSANASYQQSPPRHDSYDSNYNNSYGTMQPTVEDAPPSPGGGHYSGHRGSGSQVAQYDDRRYDQVPSPAPLNLSGRGSAASGRNSTSTAPSHQLSNGSVGYTSNGSQLSYRSQTESVSSRTSYNSMPQQDQRPRGMSEDLPGSPEYGLPPVPATLVAGMDPIIAQEISDRIYDEKRASYNQNGGSARGRYQNSSQYQSNRTHPQSYHEVVTPFVPAAATYDERQSRVSAATVPIVKPRAISPDPRSPVRKSVSPSPGPPVDKRRLSGIPFGPDSYNALNPSLSSSMPTPPLSAAYDAKDVDPDAKIITHDGREIDPSDHIPESNYAPLLEKKGPKYASQLPDRNYRPPPSQPMSAAGRRPLKQAGRPHSMQPMSTPIYMNAGPPDPSPPTGRNRLQKKANRMSAQPAPNSSPLAPITPYQDNYAPGSLPRANTGDFGTNENYAPTNYGSSPGYRGTSGPPPIPAKVPMNMNGPPPPQPGGADAWALLEEMKNIDLGSGRARRRGY